MILIDCLLQLLRMGDEERRRVKLIEYQLNGNGGKLTRFAHSHRRFVLCGILLKLLEEFFVHFIFVQIIIVNEFKWISNELNAKLEQKSVDFFFWFFETFSKKKLFI